MSTDLLRDEDKCGGKKILNNVLASRSVPPAVSVLKLFFFFFFKETRVSASSFCTRPQIM